MQLHMLLAGIRCEFTFQKSINIEPELSPFLHGEAENEIPVRVSWNWDEIPEFITPAKGDDLIQEYYQREDHWFCMTKGGGGRYIAASIYDSKLENIFCAVNKDTFSMPELTLGEVLRFLPMRAVMQRFGVLFFHGAQVSIGGKGIVFTAPSGTGKSTQANLWSVHRGAKLICNDRTLLRKTDKKWRTYGYPVDGSAPIRSGGVNELMCVVLLRQDKENSIMRLTGAKAVSLLMPQLVIDNWNPEARSIAIEGLLSLLKDIPVYQLSCTPDERAVKCLEEQLYQDGVVGNG